MSEAPTSWRGHLWTVFRAIIGIGLAGFLIYTIVKTNKVDLRTALADANVALCILAFLLYGMVVIIGVVRWRILLVVQDIIVPFWTLICLAMVGLFFNLAIPGAVGGDVIKMAYVTSHAKGKNAEAIFTIIIDRFVGIFGLFIVATIAVLCSLPELLHADPKIQLGAVVVGGGSICGIIAGVCIQFRHQLQSLPGLKGLIDLGIRVCPEKISGILERLITALDAYRDNGKAVLLAIITSCTVHSILGVVVFLIGLALGESLLAFRDYFLTTQVGNAVGAIPVTPGGFGSRDIILVELMKGAGALPQLAALIAVFYSLVVAGWSLIGGFFFILVKNKPLPESDDANATA